LFTICLKLNSIKKSYDCVAYYPTGKKTAFSQGCFFGGYWGFLGFAGSNLAYLEKKIFSYVQKRLTRFYNN